jgi:hypothetical protein
MVARLRFLDKYGDIKIDLAIVSDIGSREERYAIKDVKYYLYLES